MLSGLLFLFLLKIISITHQAEQFKRCYDLSFCNKNLYYESRPESYFIEKSSIEINKHKVTMILKTAIETENLKDLRLKIYILKSGLFRIKIQDLEKKRFHLKKEDETFNMKTMAKRKNFKIANNTDTEFIIYYFDKASKNQHFIEIDNDKKTRYEFVLHYKPFRITYTIDNKIILELNSKNLFSFEFPNQMNVGVDNDAMSSVKMDIHYNDCLMMWGLPERAADFILRDTFGDDAYRLYNVDYFKYPKDQTFGLYGSIPFILAYHQGGEFFSGFIWNNPSETYVSLKSNEGNKDVLWISESGIVDISFWADTNINNFYSKFHRYIGSAPMPPMFALGYHHSRWNFKDTQDMRTVDSLFDENDIPYDTLWLDIEVILQ